MNVPSFSSFTAHVNDHETQDVPVIRNRSEKQHKGALVRIRSIGSNPYGRLTNSTVGDVTFKPKDNEQRLLECEINVMELTGEIRQLKKELEIISPDEGHTATSSTMDTASPTDTLRSAATPGQGIASSNLMDKPASGRSGSSATPAELSSAEAGPARLTTTPSLLTSSDQQLATTLTGKPASAAVCLSSVLPISSSSAVAESVSSPAPTVTSSTYNSSRTGYGATPSDTTEKSNLATVSQTAVTPTETLKKLSASVAGSAASMVLPATLSASASIFPKVLTNATAIANTTTTAAKTLKDTVQLPVTETATGDNATSPLTLAPVSGKSSSINRPDTTTKPAIHTESSVITAPADKGKTRHWSYLEAPRQQSTTASAEEMSPDISSLARKLSAGADYSRGWLNQMLTEVTQRTLQDMRQSPTSDPKLRSALQRLGLGNAFEGFNMAIFRAFSQTWQYAMTQMNSQLLTQITPELLHYNDAIQTTNAVVSDTLCSAFHVMYQSVTDQRLKLLLGAGFMDESKLTRDELLRLKACIDNNGQESFHPANLLGVLGGATGGKKNSLLEDFLIDLIQFLEGHRKEQQSPLSLPSAPGSAQEQRFVQTMPETAEEGLEGAVTAGFLTVEDQRLFQKILNEDKDLFIDNVRQLHLRTVGNVVGGVPLDDTSPNPLFRPSIFLDIVKNPGKYHNTLGTADQSLTRADTTSQSSAPLPLMVVPLTPQGKRITGQFHVNVKKITSRALNSIQRLSQNHSVLADLEQRVLIGDTLNKLNRQLGRRLIDSFEKIHKPSTAGSAESLTQENNAADEQLIAIFQTMYATVVSERLRLFLAAGYLGEGKLSRDKVLLLKSGACNEEGKPVFTPLIKAINNNLITRRERNRFDLFLLQLSHQSSDSDKLKILSEGYRKVKGNGKLLVPRYDSAESQRRLNTILKSEKGLFIDQVKGLQLHDNQHFNAEIPLDEEGKRLLFLGSDPLDVIRYPDAYRLQINRHKDPVHDAEPTQETEPRRMRREACSPPAASSAARPRGILDSVVFGVLGGLFASANGQTIIPPALSSPADERQDSVTIRPLNRSAQLDSTGNLALATLLAAKFDDRQVTFNRVGVSTFGDQDLLATSPGMRLLNDSNLISTRLQMEVTAFVNHLDGGEPIVASWDLDDLVNMAILKVIPETTARVTETFLYEVLKSPHIGLARARLVSSSDNGLTETPHRTIVRQAFQLVQRQAGESWRTTFSGPLAIRDIVDTLDARLAVGDSIFPATQSLDPVMTILSRGRYDQGEKLFMQLSLVRQFNRVVALANEPDYLGLDYSAEPLEQLRTDMLDGGKNGHKIPRWQSLQFSQRAWQLFSHLYDSKFAAPAEAINRIKMATMLRRRSLIDANVVHQLSQLFIRLLPRRSSASDYVMVRQVHPAQQAYSQTLVQLHQFDPVQITEMISSYEALKSYTAEHFAEVFGDSISEPELREELTDQPCGANQPGEVTGWSPVGTMEKCGQTGAGGGVR